METSYSQLESRVIALMESKTCSGEEFNNCALKIYRFQRECNAPYDNYCRQAGVAVELSNWKDIPAVPQSAFKHSALRTFSEDATVKTFRTSGTTGEGFGSHYFCSLRLYDEAILRCWDHFKFPTLPQLILTPSPAQAPYSSLSYMMGVMKHRAHDGAQHFCMDDAGKLLVEELRSVIHEATTPLLVMGTALAFLHLFEEGDIPHLPAGSVAMETGGYKGSGREMSKSELYSLFTKHLGLEAGSIINEYGMTELSSQFYTTGLGNPHQGPPWMHTLVINPETNTEVAIGETGVLRIFDLANVGSVIAIQTRDLATRRENGFELIGRDPAALPRGCSRAADEILTRGKAGA